MSSTRDAYLPGVPCWIDLRQPDPDAARAFYGGLFGWSFSDEAVKRAVEHGATVLSEPADAPYVRIADVRDPQGAVITLGQYKGE